MPLRSHRLAPAMFAMFAMPAALALLLGLALAPPAGAAEAAAPAAPRLVPLWTATGLRVPESVLWDPGRQVFYVACIDGKPTERDGKGFIARLSARGEVLSLEWARGMDAPKGMGLAGGSLWVTDIDRVHAVDPETGRIARTVAAPGAKFLNDIAVGPGGEVYVSDMTTGKVHVLRGDALPVLADLSGLKGANGMLMQAGALLVGTSTGIARVDPATGRAALLVPVEGFGMIDGLKAYGPVPGEAYVVSNWAGRIQIVRAKGPPALLQDTTAQKIQAADFEYLEDSRTLIVPTFFDNRVVAYRIE